MLLPSNYLVALLAIVPALGRPMDDEGEYQAHSWPQVQREYVQVQYNPYYEADIQDAVDELMKQLETGGQVDAERGTFVQEQDPFYSQENDQGPEKAAEELRMQLEATGGDKAEAQSTSSGRVLGNGCTVALQLNENHLWLGCAGGHCLGAPCPGKFFEGADWTKCWGEVFQLYRALGPGNIVVGDFVGLYYKREGKWFSMLNGKGLKSTCPGSPNSQSGFSELEKWFICGGEVFQIYAKGKGLGAEIKDQDAITLYVPLTTRNVKFLQQEDIYSTCIMEKSGYNRPPSNEAFDQCPSESVEITIYD
jgi:hypothetical protein